MTEVLLVSGIKALYASHKEDADYFTACKHVEALIAIPTLNFIITAQAYYEKSIKLPFPGSMLLVSLILALRLSDFASIELLASLQLEFGTSTLHA